MKRAYNRAKDRELQIGVYSDSHFETKTEQKTLR